MSNKRDRIGSALFCPLRRLAAIYPFAAFKRIALHEDALVLASCAI
ncbi:hypothetical protein [Mesorhizobium sp. J8]|nr:hypothetical protein [Mesorhizobium sp. J8]